MATDERHERKDGAGTAGGRLEGIEALRRERLGAALSELELRIDELEESSDDASALAVRMARQSYDRASCAADRGGEQTAWAHVHQALRFVLQSLPEAQREAHRTALRWEAKEKLSSWRRDAVLGILGVDGDIEPANLALAQFLLHEHFANVYFKLNAAALRFRSLLWALLPAVAMLLVVSLVTRLTGADWDSFLGDPPMLLAVLVAGAVGALLSSTLSQMGIGGRIPDFLGGVMAWSVRPFIGALSAVVVCLVVESDLLPLEAASDATLLAWAAAAGFSDQLVSLVMRRVEESATK